jgi:hypothetical protein
MIGTFWNIRALNKTGRLKCISEFISLNKLEFVGFQETKKEFLSNNVLNAINKNFSWNYIPAKGSAGGILVGVKQDSLEVLGWQGLKYCAVLIIRNIIDKFTWRLIVVYGSPYDETKLEFIDELHLVMGIWVGPTLIGGDFNLVRSQREKNNGVVNFTHTSKFNDWINLWGLIEIKDPSRSYSWSNNQSSPVMATLDRILASVEWKSKYPLAQVTMLSKGVSDHNPLLITTRGEGVSKDPLFRFEKWWLQVEGFAEMVNKAWDFEVNSSDPMVVWQTKIRLLRKKIKGWSRNIGADLKRKKASILTEIDELGMLVEQQELTPQERERRRYLRIELDGICKMKKSRLDRDLGREIKEGDRNTTYFFAVANYRRRKKPINRLEDDESEIVDTPVMLKHAKQFYKSMFGKEVRENIKLGAGFWNKEDKVSPDENLALEAFFTEGGCKVLVFA